MPAAGETRELAFCLRCYAALPRGTSCSCHDTSFDNQATLDRYRTAVDAPRRRMLTDRTRRLMPAMAAAGVVVLVALVAAIVN